MKFIKQSFTTLKQNFVPLVISQVLFLSSAFFYIIFLRSYLANYLTTLGSTYSSISAIQNTTDTVAQNAQLESLVTTLEPSTRSTLILTFLITPIMLLVVWIVFQGITWKILNKKQMKNTKKYFIRFSVITIAASLILALIIYRISNTILAVITIFLLFYFMTIAYNTIVNKTIIEATGATFVQGIKKFHRLAPYILLLFISSIVQLALFIILFVSYTQKEFFFISPLLLFIYFAVCILVNLFMKKIVAEKMQQHKI